MAGIFSKRVDHFGAAIRIKEMNCVISNSEAGKFLYRVSDPI